MDSSIPQVPISIKQSATFELSILYVDTDGNPIDLSGYTAKMQVRETTDCADPPIVDLTTENGGISIDGTNGIVNILILKEDTELLPEPFKGVYDLFIVNQNGQADCLISGLVSIEGSVTKWGT